MKTRMPALLCAMLICMGIQGQNFQDCIAAYPICQKSTYHFEELNGNGNVQEQVGISSCYEGSNAKETNSIWLEWEIYQSGIVTFLIDPIAEEDDFDFILYLKSEDCSQLEEVRCNGLWSKHWRAGFR